MSIKSIGRVGDVEVAQVVDTTILAETAQAWFPDFDRDAVRPHEHWLCPHHYDPESGRIPMPVSSFVLNTRHGNVLIDTCVGNHKDRPLLGEFHRLTTNYLDRLAGIGLRPEDIDYVMCTHLHVDHVGWNTQLVDGRWVPTFPNARYVFSRTEYDATARDSRTTPVQFIRNVYEDSVLPVMEAGQVDLVDGVHEMLDVLTLRPAPGHSPGHLRIELRSGGSVAAFAGDLLHSPIQVPFWQWSSKVCWDRAMAAQTRRDLLEFCVSENVLLIPGHFQAPHVARIRSTGQQFGVEFGW